MSEPRVSFSHVDACVDAIASGHGAADRANDWRALRQWWDVHHALLRAIRQGAR